MHTRGRYSALTDGFTHTESNNKNIQCTLETEWQYTIKLMAYTTHSKVGSQYVDYANIQTIYSEVDSITLMGSTKKMS